VILVTLPPVELFIVYTCSLPDRRLAKANLVPSGDHDGV
jgi:hypothetical protein